MTLEQVPNCSDVFAVDVPMFGREAVNSPYIVDSSEPAIVDTGPADGVDVVFEGLATLGIDPSEVSYVVPTHAHLDHAGGAGYLARECENATVVCHENAVEFLTDDERLAHLSESVERAIGMPEPYGEPVVVDRERTQVVGGGETLSLGDRTLELVDAPGHAPHQLCVYDHADELLFSADAAGMRFDDYHRPTTPPPDFDLDASLDTLEQLRAFEPETLLYAHFGPGEPGSGVEELAAYAEMLPEYVAEIEAAAADHGDDVPAIVHALDDYWTHWSLATDVAGVLRYLETAEE